MVAGSITSPLNFRAMMRRAVPGGWDGFPFLDLILILTFLGVGSSAFLFSPGIEVDLAVVDVGNDEATASAVAVLTVMTNEQFFFEGQKIPRSALEATLARFANDIPEDRRQLLLKIDMATPIEESFALLALARRAGFSTVRMAGEERRSELEGWRASR